MSAAHDEEFDGLCLLYHSGELGEKDAARFQAHRAACAQCRELLEALEYGAKAAEAAAFSLPEARLDAMAAAVLGRPRAPESSPAGRNLLPILQRVWGVCAVAAALAVGIYVSDLPRSPRMELSWAHDMGSELDSIGEDLASLSQTLEFGEASDIVFDAELEELEETAQSMAGELL